MFDQPTHSPEQQSRGEVTQQFTEAIIKKFQLHIDGNTSTSTPDSASFFAEPLAIVNKDWDLLRYLAKQMIEYGRNPKAGSIDDLFVSIVDTFKKQGLEVERVPAEQYTGESDNPGHLVFVDNKWHLEINAALLSKNSIPKKDELFKEMMHEFFAWKLIQSDHPKPDDKLKIKRIPSQLFHAFSQTHFLDEFFLHLVNRTDQASLQ